MNAELLRPREANLRSCLIDWRDNVDLTQEEMAALLDVSSRYYQRLERGEKRWTDENIHRAAQILNLDPCDRHTFYVEATRRHPPLVESGGLPPDHVARIEINLCPVPALICNGVGDVCCNNEAFAASFPSLVEGDNIFLWFFCSPYGHRHLLNWERDWAPPMLAQLREAKTTASGQARKRVETIVKEVLATNAPARRLWRSAASWLSADGATKRIQTEGGREAEVVVAISGGPPLLPYSKRLAFIPQGRANVTGSLARRPFEKVASGTYHGGDMTQALTVAIKDTKI